MSTYLAANLKIITIAAVAVAGHALVVLVVVPVMLLEDVVPHVQQTVYQAVVLAAQVAATLVLEDVVVTVRADAQAVVVEHVQAHVEAGVSNRVLEDKK